MNPPVFIYNKHVCLTAADAYESGLYYTTGNSADFLELPSATGDVLDVIDSINECLDELGQIAAAFVNDKGQVIELEDHYREHPFNESQNPDSTA